MKKVFLLSVVFFLFASFVGIAEKSSKENPQKTGGWSFSFEPVFGVRVGKDYEIVWYENSQTYDIYKLSELEWEYIPIFYVGGKVFSSYKRFEISFVSKFFIPSHCGIMKDSDWLQDAYYYTGNTSIKTNYSESENHIKNGYDIELAFAFKFYPTNFLTLRPRISANYSYMKFSAVGGTWWYGDGYYYSYDSDNIKTGSMGNAEVAIYKTSNVFLWTGIQADFIPTKRLVLSIATEVAPIFYMISYDSHILFKDEYKQESLSLFYAVRQSFSALFKISDFFLLSLWLQGILTGETMGPTYYKKVNSTSGYIRNGSAGARTIYLDTGISLKFNW